MKKSVVLTGLTAATLLVSGQAFAQSAPGGTHMVIDGYNCQLGDVQDSDGNDVVPKRSARLSFNSGFHQGRWIMDQAWCSTDMDVTSVEDFVVDALGIITNTAGAGLSGLDLVASDEDIACRFLGLIQGGTFGVAEVLQSVVSGCQSDGDYWAFFSSAIFCETAAMAADRGRAMMVKPDLDRDNASICAVAFENTCEDVFEGYARDYTSPAVADCNPYVDNQGASLTNYIDNMCLYTVVP